jgi:Spy/CpxP family protein refolding chaperone
MKKVIITLVAAAFLLPLTLAAQPGTGKGPGCPPGGGMGMGDRPFMPDRHNHMAMGDGPDGPGIGGIMKMADELQLSDAQREQFKKMQTEFKLQMIDKDAAVEKAEVQLHSAMMDDKTSEVEVGRLIDQVAKLQADVQKARYSHHQQMKGVLTAEQTKKFEELRKKRFEKGPAACMGKGKGQGRDDDEKEDDDSGK